MEDNKTQLKFEAINALAMSLLSLSDAYELPESVNNIIQDLNNRMEHLHSVI
jgi:hypothetical protein